MTGKRIGLVHATLPEPGRKPGGVDIHVDRLANKLVEAGDEVVVFSSSPRPDDALYDHRPLPWPATWTSPIRRLIAAPASLNALRTDGLDVLHLHGDDWFYVRRRVPTVRTFHGSAWAEARTATTLKRAASSGVTFPLEILASRLATGSYTVSPSGARAFAALGHLPCGVTVEALGPSPRRPIVLFVGTWGGRKRGRLIWEAFTQHVRPRVTEAQLWMVSDECPAAEGVTWFKRPSDEKLAELFRAAAVFCLPSSYEGLGIPYLEAMGRGAAVVASDNPGARYILRDGDHGVIADDAELPAAVTRLLEDADHRERVAAAGSERVQQFAWEHVIADHHAAYERAIEARCGGDRRRASG